jgi:tRNA G18 (ribose-2'-O)-methylase SpoU
MIEIHDPNDPRIVVFLNQKDAWLKASHNPSSSAQDAGSDGFFIAEGVLVVEQLVRSTFPLSSLLVAKGRVDGVKPLLEQIERTEPSVPIYVAEQEVMDQIVGYPIHRGLLACGRRLPNPDPMELARSCRALVVLEDLSNHDNVGSVFRSVAALGGKGVGVWITRRCCDPLYRKALRVSMGHVLHTPFAIVDQLIEQLDGLSSLGFTTVALTPDNDSMTLGESINRGVDKPVLLLGAEGPGLSRAVIDAADQCVRIEMTNDVDSLNIAVAAAVSMHRYLDPQ